MPLPRVKGYWDWTQAVAWIAFDALDAPTGTIHGQGLYEESKFRQQYEQAHMALTSLIEALATPGNGLTRSEMQWPVDVSLSNEDDLRDIVFTLGEAYTGHVIGVNRSREWQDTILKRISALPFERAAVLEGWPQEIDHLGVQMEIETRRTAAGDVSSYDQPRGPVLKSESDAFARKMFAELEAGTLTLRLRDDRDRYISEGLGISRAEARKVYKRNKPERFGGKGRPRKGG